MHDRSPYEPVAQHLGKDEESEYCTVRKDDAGIWNILKTYSIYVVHLAAAACMDSHSCFAREQGNDTTRDLPVKQLQYANPTEGESERVVVVVWLGNLGDSIAMAANLRRPPCQFIVGLDFRRSQSWGAYQHELEWPYRQSRGKFLVASAVVRTGASSAYAFNNTISSQRYFARPIGSNMTNSSVITAPLPYLDLQIRWVNGTSNDTWSKMIKDTTLSDYVGSRDNGVNRAGGAVVVMEDSPWDRTNDWPSQAAMLEGGRLIAVKVF
ncbi:hypothetical protein P171DRAFT_474984 [Karstenula rhodostoma CBS 690.94]|uniref:Uncharacterized protein n=1 Tax=Karstenula rhodostoma CBS 690.94 TaxID=1392251 RepID=A0A9P4PDN1_9PLEO|nr:hypothetical protein P171DRAFT_474984 [Karstenula rhodostoma CBS 690.94]